MRDHTSGAVVEAARRRSGGFDDDALRDLVADTFGEDTARRGDRDGDWLMNVTMGAPTLSAAAFAVLHEARTDDTPARRTAVRRRERLAWPLALDDEPDATPGEVFTPLWRPHGEHGAAQWPPPPAAVGPRARVDWLAAAAGAVRPTRVVRVSQPRVRGPIGPAVAARLVDVVVDAEHAAAPRLRLGVDVKELARLAAANYVHVLDSNVLRVDEHVAAARRVAWLDDRFGAADGRGRDAALQAARTVAARAPHRTGVAVEALWLAVADPRLGGDVARIVGSLAAHPAAAHDPWAREMLRRIDAAAVPRAAA